MHKKIQLINCISKLIKYIYIYILMIHEILVVLWLSHYLNNILIKYNIYVTSAREFQPESYVAKPRPFVFQVEDSFIF